MVEPTLERISDKVEPPGARTFESSVAGHTRPLGATMTAEPETPNIVENAPTTSLPDKKPATGLASFAVPEEPN